MEISTSILSIENENIVQTFYDIEVAKTDYFHIDVMDGKFVKQDTSNKMLESAETLKHISNVPLDIHLMVEDVESYVEEYLPLEPRIITIHYESFKNKNEINQIIQKIKSEGIKVGISIKPNTQVEEIKEFLPYINLVLVMTVEPGYGGQTLIQECVKKIIQLKQYAENYNLEYFIEADGGINLDTINQVKEAGCDIAVVGTAIVNEENKKEIIKKLKEK